MSPFPPFKNFITLSVLVVSLVDPHERHAAEPAKSVSGEQQVSYRHHSSRSRIQATNSGKCLSMYSRQSLLS